MRIHDNIGNFNNYENETHARSDRWISISQWEELNHPDLAQALEDAFTPLIYKLLTDALLFNMARGLALHVRAFLRNRGMDPSELDAAGASADGAEVTVWVKRRRVHQT